MYRYTIGKKGQDKTIRERSIFMRIIFNHHALFQRCLYLPTRKTIFDQCSNRMTRPLNQASFLICAIKYSNLVNEFLFSVIHFAVPKRSTDETHSISGSVASISIALAL